MPRPSLRNLLIITIYCTIVTLAYRCGWYVGFPVAVMLFTVGRRAYYAALGAVPLTIAERALHWSIRVAVALLVELGLLVASAIIAYLVFVSLRFLAWNLPTEDWSPPVRDIFQVTLGTIIVLCGPAMYGTLHYLTMRPFISRHKQVVPAELVE